MSARMIRGQALKISPNHGQIEQRLLAACDLSHLVPGVNLAIALILGLCCLSILIFSLESHDPYREISHSQVLLALLFLLVRDFLS